MGWTLAPDVSFCIASGKAIFLDTRADRYACLPGQMNASFVRWTAGEVPEAAEAVAMLHRAGLLKPVGGNAAPEPYRVAAATSGVPARRLGRVTWVLSCARFRHDLHLARRRLARRGLFEALGHAAMRRAVVRSRRDPRTIAPDLLAVGAALGPGDDCLVRSLALLDSLHRAGSDGTLVFGVLAMPFRAHCWIQYGDCVLNDHPDRVSIFTPILTV